MVDDSASNLTVGRSLLSGMYNLYTCNSGERMFKLLEKIIPDLILLDVEMPEMGGYEVIERLKENRNTSDIPVIFLTAHHDEETEAKGRLLGATDFITKPFPPSVLLERIEAYLAEAQKPKAEVTQKP